MCGRFTLQIPPELLKEIFGLLEIPVFPNRYNIAPTQKVAAVRAYSDGTRHLDFLSWGLIPSWANDPSIGSRMINARSETADTKPSFRTALKHRRCVIPASGFYEWKAEGKRKKPYYIKMKNDGPMMFAGLWDHWKSPDGELVESCTILTTETNELIKPLHDRMPVILDPGDYGVWLDNQIADPEKLKHFFRSYPSEMMEMYPVSDIVNSSRNDYPSCIDLML